MEGLVLSRPEYFMEHRKRFEVLRLDATEYLHLPGRFAVRALYDVDTALVALGPADYKQWVDTICRAGSLEQLRSGVPAYASNLVSTGLDIQKLLSFRQAGSGHHRSRMEAIRAAKTCADAPHAWALSMLRSLGIIAKDKSDLDRFVEALSAAYAYELCLIKLAANTGYRFDAKERHGDRIDSEILFYLAAPDMHIVTDDENLRKRCADSPQAARVLLLKDLSY